MDWAMAATASLKINLFQDAYNNLKKILANKWEFVMMQADEQVRWLALLKASLKM